MTVPRDGRHTFARMARAEPLRTGVFTFGPLLLALAQGINVHVHGGPVAVAVVFAAVMLTYSVQVTRYHLAAFRQRTHAEV